MESVLVTLIVFIAFAYAVCKMVPQALRKSIAAVISGICGWVGWNGPGAVRFAQRIAADPQCHGCETCGGCQRSRP